jgi:hypothetical protein
MDGIFSLGRVSPQTNVFTSIQLGFGLTVLEVHSPIRSKGRTLPICSKRSRNCIEIDEEQAQDYTSNTNNLACSMFCELICK